MPGRGRPVGLLLIYKVAASCGLEADFNRAPGMTTKSCRTEARFAGPTVPLEQVDADTLRRLVGGEG